MFQFLLCPLKSSSMYQFLLWHVLADASGYTGGASDSRFKLKVFIHKL